MKKVFSILIVMLLCMTIVMPVMAESELPRLIDEADLLFSDEEQKLQRKLDSISERLQFDVVVLTVDSLEGYSPMEFADDFYDYGGYGKDGILWLIDMDNRKSTISTSGYGITVFTDAGQDYMQDRIAPMLTDEEYGEAIEVYIDLCDDFCRQADEGAPYDVGNLPKEPFDTGMSVIIAVVVGIIVALIGTGIMKGQLKSVRAKAEATDYMKPGSLQLTEARDFFLYRHIDRREKPKNNGGSSTHRSSSGNSHGGSSRSF